MWYGFVLVVKKLKRNVKKSIFRKGGAYFYQSSSRLIKYSSSKTLKITKPVLKDFSKSFGAFISTQLFNFAQKFIRKKV